MCKKNNERSSKNNSINNRTILIKAKLFFLVIYGPYSPFHSAILK